MCEGTLLTVIGLMSPTTLASMIADAKNDRTDTTLNYDRAEIITAAVAELYGIVGRYEAEQLIAQAER